MTRFVQWWWVVLILIQFVKTAQILFCWTNDQVLISRLPDRGERIHKQIDELNLQLSELRRKEHESEVIEIADEFQEILNV